MHLAKVASKSINGRKVLVDHFLALWLKLPLAKDRCTIDVYFASKIVCYCFTNIVTAIKEFCFKEEKWTYSPPTVETHCVEPFLLTNIYLIGSTGYESWHVGSSVAAYGI